MFNKFWIIEDWNLDRDPVNDYAARPLIQCKECRYMKKVRVPGTGEEWYRCYVHNHSVKSDYFCSWGRPKEIHDADN